MENGREEVDLGKREEEDDRVRSDLIRDKFRLVVISICESQAKKNGMEIAEVVVSCIADLAFKLSEQLAKDLELFAQHAGRKTVNVEDVILSAHRNDDLTSIMRTFSNELKVKDPQTDRKRKKSLNNEDAAI